MDDTKIPTGVAVVTRDGVQLGSVKDVTARCFKVDAPFHRDYWLSRECISTQSETAVVLDLVSAAVSEHQLDAPELAPEEDPFKDVAMKPVITDEELLEQRAKMERELAEQSRALPPHEPSPTQLRGPRAYERIPADHTGFESLAGEYVPNAPVQDRIQAELAPRSRQGARRVLMLGIPLALGAATLGGIMIFRRRRNSVKAQTAGVRRQLRKSAHVARDEARQCASSVAHAAKPVARSLATRAKDRARRTLHDGLSAAAKQFA